MTKLTKAQSKLHLAACKLLADNQGKDSDIEFIFKHWHEGAALDQTASGAFFTPPEMAQDFRIEVSGERIIDLCAGIGVLSYYAYHFGYERYNMPKREMVCIERCPQFVEVGKKLLPEATWICADIFDFDFSKLGHFDCAIANPPFGRPQAQKIKKRNYQGAEMEYHIIDLASEIADYGSFIIPQQSSPFVFSGAQYFDRRESAKYKAFEKQTRIMLDGGCGIDTSVFDEDWKGSAIRTEIVCADFMEAREQRKPAQASLFEMVA